MSEGVSWKLGHRVGAGEAWHQDSGDSAPPKDDKAEGVTTGANVWGAWRTQQEFHRSLLCFPKTPTMALL